MGGYQRNIYYEIEKVKGAYEIGGVPPSLVSSIQRKGDNAFIVMSATYSLNIPTIRSLITNAVI